MDSMFDNAIMVYKPFLYLHNVKQSRFYEVETSRHDDNHRIIELEKLKGQNHWLQLNRRCALAPQHTSLQVKVKVSAFTAITVINDMQILLASTQHETARDKRIKYIACS